MDFDLNEVMFDGEINIIINNLDMKLVRQIFTLYGTLKLVLKVT